MEQIAVVKITPTAGGENRRNMMLPKNIWDQIVANDYKDASSRFELRKVEKVAMKETKIIKNDTKEVKLDAETETEETETDAPEEKSGNDASPVSTKDAGKGKKFKKRS